ncbi:MAG: methyltransferase domain-containing protein [Acidimicrobiales bacterium]
MKPVRALLYRAAGRYSLYNRRRKARIVTDLIAAVDARTVLFVGVGADEEDRTNLFESLVAEVVDAPVGAGLGPGAPAFTATYVQADGRALPFPDASFDLVISNAVIEHVGQVRDQAIFVAEHRRVGRAAVITTPNRHFPIEAHTGAVFVHVRPGWTDTDGYVTRLLSKRDFEALLPSGTVIRGHRLSPTLTAIVAAQQPTLPDRAQVPG